MHLCSIDWGSICLLYICTVLDLAVGASGMQGISAQLTGGSICLLYICIVLDLAVGVVVCKGHLCSIDWGGPSYDASMLDWLGDLSAIYMYCPRSSSGFSVNARHLCSNDWGSICLLYICIVLDLAVGVAVCKSIYAQLTGEGHMKSNGIQGIYALLTGGSICLLYICIVLDLAVGVVVCKASMLKWLGGPSAFYIYALS